MKQIFIVITLLVLLSGHDLFSQSSSPGPTEVLKKSEPAVDVNKKSPVGANKVTTGSSENSNAQPSTSTQKPASSDSAPVPSSKLSPKKNNLPLPPLNESGKTASPSPMKKTSKAPSNADEASPSPAPSAELKPSDSAKTPTQAPVKDTPATKKRVKAYYAIFNVTISGKKVRPFKAKLFHLRAPKNVANFINLVEGTKIYRYKGRTYKNTPFYKNLDFHIISRGYIIQTGDPLGNGRGGPGYTVEDEFHPGLKHDKEGTLAMANSGPNTNGSQFYITLRPQKSLNNKYTVFGQIIEGMKNVHIIGRVPVKANDRPRIPVKLVSIKIEREY